VAAASPAEITAREALMQAYLEAWNLHDPDAVVAFFATDAVYDDRGADVVCRGIFEIRAHVAAVEAAFPDIRFELVRSAHGSDFTAAEWTATMTHEGELDELAASGRQVKAAGIDVATLDEHSRISHLASYYDGAAIMRQLGLLPPRRSRLERALLRAASLLPRQP
jgi:steroid delta-isomerase-like uncharacterized protein